MDASIVQSNILPPLFSPFCFLRMCFRVIEIIRLIDQRRGKEKIFITFRSALYFFLIDAICRYLPLGSSTDKCHRIYVYIYFSSNIFKLNFTILKTFITI